MERGDEDASEGSEQQEWPEHATGERRRGRSEEAISTHMAQKRAELQWERSNRSWRTGKDETNDGTRPAPRCHLGIWVPYTCYAAV